MSTHLSLRIICTKSLRVNVVRLWIMLVCQDFCRTLIIGINLSHRNEARDGCRPQDDIETVAFNPETYLGAQWSEREPQAACALAVC